MKKKDIFTIAIVSIIVTTTLIIGVGIEDILLLIVTFLIVVCLLCLTFMDSCFRRNDRLGGDDNEEGER